MTRRKVVTEVDEDIDGMPELDEDELSMALGEMEDAGGAIVRVERLREGKRPQFAGELSAAGFSLPLLQERFGGGDYALTLLDRLRRYRKRSTVSVDAPLVSPVKADAPLSGLEKLTQAVMASMKHQQEMVALLMSRGQATAAPIIDPQVMRTQLLQDLSLMKQIVGGGQGVGPDKLIEVLKAGMDIARDAAAGGEGDVMSVISKAVDVLGQPLADMMRANTATPAAQPVGSMVMPALPIAGEVSPAAKQQAKQQRGGGMNVQQALKFLVAKAGAGADPGLYADLILDNVDPAVLERLLSGDVVASLSQFDARVSAHAQWFRDLGAMLSEALRADDVGTGSESPAADGDAGGNPVGP